MPLTATQYQTLILSELGTADKGDPAINEAYETLEANLPLYWTMYEDQKGVGIRLRYLYVKRQCIDFLLGAVWQHVTNSDADVNESLDQFTEHLKGLREVVETEIMKVEKGRIASRGPQIGVITVTAPLEPATTLEPDPNDRLYRGDALRRFGFRRR